MQIEFVKAFKHDDKFLPWYSHKYLPSFFLFTFFFFIIFTNDTLIMYIVNLSSLKRSFRT